MSTDCDTARPAVLATLADRQAQSNFTANRSALSNRGDVSLRGVTEVIHNVDLDSSPGEWVFARDGSLTVLDADGRFFNGCSVPTRAARRQLAGFVASGSCVCLLAAPHAAAVRETLDRLRPEQALIVIQPDRVAGSIMLRCDDFSVEINSGRLWLAIGPRWSDDLRSILQANPGLAIPAQFVRLKMEVAEVDELIGPAQAVFAEVSAQRARALDQAGRNPTSSAGTVRRLCVVGGTRFRLWNDAGHELMRVARDEDRFEVVPFDSDHPLCATPLSLAEVASSADGILTADICRTDVPEGVAPKDMPWVAWLTRRRTIPSPEDSGPRDRMIAASPDIAALAIAAGWPEDRVLVAGWPIRLNTAPPRGNTLGLILNIPSLAPPQQVVDFSSHRLLWEWVTSAMNRDPLSAFDSAEKLLRRGADQIGVNVQELPWSAFIDGLIVPMYAIGIARLLRAAGLRLRLWGEGWQEVDGLSDLHAGVIRNRGQFGSAVLECRALIDPVPISGSHAIDALLRPVVRPMPGMSPRALIASARASLSSGATAITSEGLSIRTLRAAFGSD